MRDSSCGHVVIQLGKFWCFFFGHPWKVVANDRTGTTWKFDSSTVYYICITDEVTYQIL